MLRIIRNDSRRVFSRCGTTPPGRGNRFHMLLLSAGTLLAFFSSGPTASVSQRILTFAQRVAYQRAIEDEIRRGLHSRTPLRGRFQRDILVCLVDRGSCLGQDLRARRRRLCERKNHKPSETRTWSIAADPCRFAGRTFE
jgi:hypothetical protein